MPDAFVDTIAAEVGDWLASQDNGKSMPVVTCTVEFGLEPSHLAAYAEGSGHLTTTVKSDEKDLNVLRARHHAVARYLAAGLSEGIVAELTDFTPSYLSTLKKNPAMAQLIVHYSAPGASAAALAQERLRTAADGALERLISKLEAGTLTSQEELALAKLGYDRSGVGPQSTVKAETVHTDVAEVMKLHQDARNRDAGRLHRVEDVRANLPRLAPPDAADAA